MIKLLLASNNRGKYDELVDAFAKEGIELIFDGNLDLIEDSPTLELNAISKAQSASKQKNMYSISDDTGFFIPTLDYFPGVHANRWMEGSWKDKRDAILKMMECKTDRRAYLLNKFALSDPSGNIIGQYEVKNWYEIAYEDHINPDHPTFGYNPMLIIQGHYVGKLTSEQRYFIKNRGRFAPQVKEVLLNELRNKKE
jgi:XTP/dITP diphosphohydrolase